MKRFVLICNRQPRKINRSTVDTFEAVLTIVSPIPLLVFLLQTRKMKDHLSVAARLLVQVRLQPEILLKSLDIDWHALVDDNLDIFRIMAYASIHRRFHQEVVFL